MRGGIMGGWGIVLIVMAAILFGPAIIIAVSKRVAGWNKVRWVLHSLLPLLIVPLVIAIAINLVFPTEKGLANLYMSTIYPIPTYASVWIVFIIFRIKNPRC